MFHVAFLLIVEGSSDAALVSHLEEHCLLCGAEEVSGVAPDLALLPEVGHSVIEKLEVGLRLEPAVDLVFLHRDSDSPDPEPRHHEIRRAVGEVANCPPAVPVVPVQETEAWLLLDEMQIRKAAANPNGAITLELPPPEEVETITDPKESLFEVLCLASELSGRKLRRFRRNLTKCRRRLLEELGCGGSVSRVPSWQRLRADLQEALIQLRAAADGHG